MVLKKTDGRAWNRCRLDEKAFKIKIKIKKR
jgi:hypothetical protein